MDPLPDFLQPLEFVAQPFSREAVEAAIARREESIPHLLGALEWASSQRDALKDDYILHHFALFLLAEFRERRALRPMVELFRHAAPFDDLNELAADNLPAIFASVAGEDLTPLHEIIEDGTANEWSRAACLRALGTLTLRGTMPREALTAYLGELFAGRLERIPSQAWNGLISVCVELRLTQFLPAIRQAYEDEVADQYFREPEDAEAEIQRPPLKIVPRHAEVGDSLIESAIEEMERWGCFDPKAQAEETEDVPYFPADYSASTPYVRPFEKIGRNDPCPCGSGRKFKKCCNANL